MKKIVFVANSSKRYRYYRRISAQLGEKGRVIFPFYPSLALLIGVFKTLPCDKDELLSSHLRRQQINYPNLYKFTLLWQVFCFFAHLVERARFYHYYQIFCRLDCEAVAIWNGQKQPYITMVKAAQQAKKRILYFENGLMPNTTTADYTGVNAYNCLPRDPQFYLDLPDNNIQTHLPTKLITRAPHKKRNIKQQSIIELPDKYIFIPFQVPADSQVVIHSPWIQSMEHMFNTLRQIHSQLREAGHTDLPHLVFKEHPSWPNNFAELYQQDHYCLFANQNPTQQLIEHAQAVITINSTVGLESLLLGKKVIILGNACYNIEQLVLHANDPQQLYQHISNIETWQPNETLRRNFLTFIASVYCIPHGWENILHQSNTEHLDAISKRVLQTDQLSDYLSDYLKAQ